MEASQERLLFEHLGESCLLFLLNTSADRLRKYLEDADASQLNDVQREIVSQLVVADTVFFRVEDSMFTGENWARHLMSRESTARESIGNAVRRVAGGVIAEPDPSLSDAPLTLVQLAIDVYPGFLVKEDDSPFRRMGMPISIFHHPLSEQFQNQVLADSVLKKLFPNDSESAGPSGSTMRTSGSGGGTQLWMFAETLLSSGWRLARLDAITPTIEGFIEKALESFDVVRSATSGGAAEIPVRVGLTGVLLPEGVNELELGSVHLRRTDDRDQHFVKMTNLEGQLTGTDEQGQTAVINYAGDLVMECNIPYLVEIGNDPTAMLEFSPRLRKALGKIEYVAQNLRLGLLLACPDIRPTLLTTWQVTLDPLSAGQGAGWSDARQGPGLMPRQLNADQVASWQEWADRIDGVRTPSIEVSVGRMLAAVAERRRPDDVLVDAVIVWENMFGAATETTLRVTTSLAWLLGTSEADRRKKQTEYKKIYQYRSAVVHGAPNPELKKVQDYSQQAINVSIAALRAVFKERPELLSEKSSEERSLRILHAGISAKNV